MLEYAEIIKAQPTQDGTHLHIFIPGRNLLGGLVEKLIHSCSVMFDDGRRISADQRKKVYATLNDIAAYTGYLPEEQKEWMKYYYIGRTGGKYFSLSTCTIDTAREFINVMMDFALENGIPLLDFGVNRTDDIGRYLYACLKHKKCAICGGEGEIHHVDTIGMGRDRQSVDDSSYRKICLCRCHHSEAHTIGMQAFETKRHVYGIKFNVEASVA